MIQRIQSLYLLLSLICTGLFYFFPFGDIITTEDSIIPLIVTGVRYTKNGETVFYSLLPMLIMISLINLISLTSIFLYKRRMLQIRLNIFNIITQLGSIGMIFYYLSNAAKQIGVDYSTKILIILPLVSAIFTFLAVRAIAKDEALVRSISRLRK
ncbi:MAG TPA: DUF4293 domain-containing protein [Bacteroidales bacterium]|nr:DUF4293 domain-containing protein [Bacteroidales bacterium]